MKILLVMVVYVSFLYYLFEYHTAWAMVLFIISAAYAINDSFM